MITLTLTEIIIRISIAVGLGALLGLERTLAGKNAGLRTYAMVSLGSSMFIIIAAFIFLLLNLIIKLQEVYHKLFCNIFIYCCILYCFPPLPPWLFTFFITNNKKHQCG